jgi:SAM-dependent methyltransferase
MHASLLSLTHRPLLYEKSTAKFWDDEHISQQMLASHLDPDWDAATRKHAFVRESVRWISQTAPPDMFKSLLDLGCGPGIYAEYFHDTGYSVTGVDFSERSIRYARDSAREKGKEIEYIHRDYLTIDFIARFNLVTIINYDFGVLSTPDRALLLRKIHTALTPGGLFIFDVFTPEQYRGRTEFNTWEFTENGFFSASPYLRLHSLYIYPRENTYCDQHIVVTEQEAKCINIWEHVFTKEELERDLYEAGFDIRGWYGHIAGGECTEDGKEICVIAEKR